MTIEDKNEIERLLRIKTAHMGDKDSCQRLIIAYINPGYKFCKTCDPAIRAAFNLLRNWWAKQNHNAFTFIQTKVAR